MRFEVFKNLYIEKLYEMWENWIPYENDSDKHRQREVHTVYDEEIEDYREYVDDGFRKTSFRTFMYAAYENTIP